MDELCSLDRKALQSRITDYFNCLNACVVEQESYCPFHQTLITDYFREISGALVGSQINFYSRSVSIIFKSVLHDLSHTSELRTPMSKFVRSGSVCTHVSEIPEVILTRKRAQMLDRHNNVNQAECFVQRSL
ncbi:hypothetical protein KC19_VG194600 [Ceratodon purpureus]|uniref:Uncharacterized protein n=1 Tax=Ceratodon purpureus TaxID=3225 RepID=A0A8T0HSA6_CERPU|nr:hypothetical protein KC19_VG194600 [Ceratodon purpureus]